MKAVEAGFEQVVRGPGVAAAPAGATP
jgi:hypothetical protein